MAAGAALVTVAAGPSLLAAVGVERGSAAAPSRLPLGPPRLGELAGDPGDDEGPGGFVFAPDDEDAEPADDLQRLYPDRALWPGMRERRAPVEPDDEPDSFRPRVRFGTSLQALRILASSRDDAEELGRVKAGASLRILKEQGDWALVLSDDAVMGWAKRSGIAVR